MVWQWMMDLAQPDSRKLSATANSCYYYLPMNDTSSEQSLKGRYESNGGCG